MSAPAPVPSRREEATHAPVRAALLGSGLFATNSYLPSLVGVPGLHITHTWSRSAASGTAFAEKAAGLDLPFKDPVRVHGDDGLAEILANDAIDAVVMVLPIGVQPELIRRCWAAGKHVISEKPIGRDVREARALVEEYEQEWAPKGLVWHVAENYAHEPWLLYGAELLRDPRIGPVLYWRMHYETMLPDGASYQATSWRNVPDYQGGFLLDGGVHWAAALRTVLPRECKPASVIASKSLHRSHMLPHDTLVGMVSPGEGATRAPLGARPQKRAGTLDEAAMPVQPGASTPHGTFLLSWGIPDTPRDARVPNELYVVCEHATVRLVNHGRAWTVSVQPGAGSDAPAIEEKGPVSGVERELADYAEAVARAKEGKPPQDGLGNPRHALWDVAFIQAALNSDGNKVVIDDVLRA